MNTHSIKIFILTTLYNRNTAGILSQAPGLTSVFLLKSVGSPFKFFVLCFVFWFRFVLFVFVMCLVHLLLTLSLNYQFLIDPSVFSNVYLIQILSLCSPKILRLSKHVGLMPLVEFSIRKVWRSQRGNQNP